MYPSGNGRLLSRGLRGQAGRVDSKRHTRQFWKQLSAEVDRGRSISDVARRHRVRPKTLSWWRWQMQRRTPRSPAPKLLPVHVPNGEVVVGRGRFAVQV